MALTKKQLAMMDSCPILKSMKSDLISALGVEESSSSNSGSSSNTDTNQNSGTDTPTSEVEKRNISVNVTDGNNPVQSATVELVKDGNTIASSTTGSAGGCTLTNVEDGSYVINVTKEGFVTYSKSVTTSVDNNELSIELTASPSSP